MKNQFKKSLSLIMAVLMLMSCWVWVAPDNTKAADEEEEITKYYFKVVTNVTDTGNEDKSTITVKYKLLNGTGAEKSTSVSYDQQGWSGETVVFEGAIDGWPTEFTFYMKLGGGRTETHENITMYVGTSKDTCNINCGSYGKAEFYQDLTTSSKKFDTFTVKNSAAAPKFNEITKAEATAPSATLGKLPNGADVTATVKATGGKDQYGVKWAASLPTSGFSYSLKYTNEAGDEVALGSTYATVSGSSNSATVYLKDDLQTLFPGDKGTKLQAYCTYNNTTAGASINVDFPTYKATFDSNGGLIGDDSSSAKTQVEVTSDKTYYGSVIGKAPAYASKNGFDFMGYYSAKNADATGKTASFTGTKFVDSETTVPSQGDTTWYAAWQAKPVYATFVTADNQLIGTLEGRYNNALTNGSMYGSNLNSEVKALYNGNGISFDSSNAPVYKDGATTYTFAGWKIIKAYSEDAMDKDEDYVLKGDVTFQATYTKSSAKTYTVTFKDAKGNTLTTKPGYKYRDPVTNVPSTEPQYDEENNNQDDVYKYSFIGWAKDIGKSFYTVDENDKDINGATIAYTSKEDASFVVKGDASYVPVFRMIKREYSVTYNYTGDNKTTESTVINGYNWDATPSMPEIKDNYTYNGFRYFLIGWNVGDDTLVQLDELKVNGNMTLTAVYGNPEAAKYTINFFGKAEDGVNEVHLNEGANTYTHNSTVTAPEVSQTIDTDDSRYTFNGWSPAVNTTASGDADYYAQYIEKKFADVYFYNYDGTLLSSIIGNEGSEKLFEGDKIPPYNGEAFEKVEDVIGTYKFIGWMDSEGNLVEPGEDVLTGDTYLTAQFETVYNEYEVKFINEGNVIEGIKTKYHYGEEIDIPADPSKEKDVEYTYKFKGWDIAVLATCEGDATYTATYSRTPRFYKVTWLDDSKAVKSYSNYKYNAKISAGIADDQPKTYDNPSEGKTWAFAYWVQCDENGNAIRVDGKPVKFVYGMKMEGEALWFYPVYEEVDKVYTVKFYQEDGTTFIGETTYAHGAEISSKSDAFEEKVPVTVTESEHKSFEKWVDISNKTEVNTITSDISVKASLKEESHKKDVEDTTVAPTCTVIGFKDVSCSVCGKTWEDVIIDPVADTAAPEGQIYVGDDKWTLEEYNEGINYNDVKFISPGTQLVVNAWDKGSEGSLSRGVGKIEYYVANGTVDATAIRNWTEIYNYEKVKTETLNEVLAEKDITLVEYNGYNRGEAKKKAEIDREVDARLAGYKANASGIASNLNLVNGQEYVIYIKVSDREGNGEVNSCIFSSGKISYGSNAPEIAISGEGSGAKFCTTAEITVTDDTDGVKVYLDGEEKTLVDGKLPCNTKGSHTVVAVDKNGNKTTKIFEIKGVHSYKHYKIDSSCDNTGSEYDLCTVCGDKTEATEIAAKGHKYISYTEKDPTCTTNGYRIYTCDNNCKSKLTITPASTAAEIALAKVKTDNDEYRDLTLDDIKHLLATGVHTYAKVKDAEGNDTAEDAWVIDVAPTCKDEGSKHKDCIKCGLPDARITEIIPVDKENGHKFNRETIPDGCAPTCQEIGKKTKVCRYCGEEVTTGYIDALGHVAGEYVTLTPATCTEPGKEILTCAVCDSQIGEPDANGKWDPMKEPVAKEIPALGHKYKIDGDVYSVVVTDGTGETFTVYYQNYKCSKCDDIDKRKLEDYKPPVAATVTFDFNGGSYVIPAVGEPNEFGYVPEMLKGTQTINAFVGETITADSVETAVKQSNATYTYKFAYWATKNADGSYTEVKFPIEVKGDATYYAVYSDKYVNYTITYYTEDDNKALVEIKVDGYRHNGEEVTLAAGPSKAGNWQYNYKFEGWVVNGSDPEVVYTDKVTINAANINLKAKYRAVQKSYAVTYAITQSEILETFSVLAGSEARDCKIIPAKEFDTKYHYTFTGWNKAAQLAKVESNIYTTPDFNKVEHVYTIEKTKSEAACGVNKVVTKICECGYSYDEEVEGSALDHLWSTPSFNEETGKNIITCNRTGCGESIEDSRKYTAVFYNAKSEAIKTVNHISWGTTIDALKLPAAPTKDSTATTDYTFAGWAIKGTTEIIDFTELEIKQDYEFVPVFTETARKYNVTFRAGTNNNIYTVTVDAGDDVVYDEKYGIPVKASDDKNHYTFSGWDKATTNIQKDTVVTAEFTATPHSKVNVITIGTATCTTGTGTINWCDCNGNGAYDEGIDKADKKTNAALGHALVETDERVEATPDEAGYVMMKCTREGCNYTEKKTLNYVDDKVTVTVTVKCNGAAKSGIQLKVQPARGGDLLVATTNTNGVAIITNAKKDVLYDAWVVIDGKEVQITLTSDGKGNWVGSYEYEVKEASDDCGCACHRTSIWGGIFRFFHKIIKLFTGEFKCCNDPDPMYG